MNTKDKLIHLLIKTEQAHGAAFAKSQGVDPHWAAWYADFLIKHNINNLIKEMFDKETLVKTLVQLDKDYRNNDPSIGWSKYYAKHLVEARNL